MRWAWELDDPRLIDIATEHPACGCQMCVNPRRERGELSLQERRAAAVPSFALSVEPVVLELTYVEPRFNWGDEVDIDLLDGRKADSQQIQTESDRG